jgi:hypothetical protein
MIIALDGSICARWFAENMCLSGELTYRARV